MLADKPVIGCNEAAVNLARQGALRLGMRVVLQGLQSATELNGHHGVVISEAPGHQGRWEVETMQGSEPRRLLLKPANLQWLGPTKASQPVPKPPPTKFGGLSALVEKDMPGGQVEFSKVLSLRPENLEVLQSDGSAGYLQRGSRVRVHGLKAAATYNWSYGRIRSKGPASDGRWEVEISKVFRLPQATVEVHSSAKGIQVRPGVGPATTAAAQPPPPPGATVMLHGLKAKTEYNGEWGRVISGVLNEDGRVEVDLAVGGDNKRLLLKPENLAPEVPPKE